VLFSVFVSCKSHSYFGVVGCNVECRVAVECWLLNVVLLNVVLLNVVLLNVVLLNVVLLKVVVDVECCVVDIFPESCDNVDLYLFTISMYFSSLKYYY
jgi:hypothetical protein